MKTIGKLALLALALCAAAGPVSAQSSTGRLIGTISGPDGVIPGATVVVTDARTGRERTVVTTGEGAFIVPLLDAGDYTVRVAATGFKTFTASAVKIDVGKEYSLNPTLEIGSTQESITVTAGADVINATNAELSNTVSPQQVKELPLNGRNPLNLIQLQAGTAANGAQTTSINGARPSFTNISRDGLNVNDNFIRANASDFSSERPSVDDTDEFTITTQNANASQNGAAQVQLVTPRGTSDFHGALFFYNRASVLTANDFFNNAAGIPRPFLNRNQFGGTISGPAPLPRFGEGGPVFLKDKLYFFGSYEGLRRRNSTARQRLVLLPSARQGNFTFRDSAGAVRTVNLFGLPVTGGGGGVPAPTGIDPMIQSRILDQMPAAGNRADLGDGLNTTGYGFDQQQNQNRDAYTTRVDLDLNERHAIHGVYTHKDEGNLRPDADGVNGFNPTPLITQAARTRFLALAYRQVLGASFTNEIRGGRFKTEIPFERTAAPPPFIIGGVISPVPANTPAAFAILNNPEVSFLNQGRVTDYYNLQDNADLIRGSHSLRFGANAQWYKVDPFNDAGIVPTVFLGVGNNTPQLTNASFASVLPPGATIDANQLTNANKLYALLGGVISTATQTFNPTSRDSGFVQGATALQQFAWENIGLYVSDQWRLQPELTLNLGLRYELQTPLRNTNGVFLEPVLDPDNPVASILDPNGQYNYLGTNAGGNNFYRTDKNNFAPILGVAWSPGFKNKFLGGLLPGGGRTVIRAGFRMSYVNDELVTAPRNAAIGNVGLGATAVNATQVIGGASTAQLNARLANPPTSFVTPQVLVPKSYAANNTAQFGNFGAVFGVDPRLQAARTTEYTFSIQRELGFQTALEVRYVGSRSKDLIRATDYNQVEIRSNGFLEDFLRARNNLVLAGNGNPNASTNYNCSPNFAGCQPLQIIGTSRVGALGQANILNRLRDGQVADLALAYVQGGVTAGFPFLPNPNTGTGNLLDNGGEYYYNALQAELRKRFSAGLYFQANYTFQKILTNAVGTAQARVEPYLDLRQPELEYSRADYDGTHIFNFNGIYELPFGRNRRFMNGGGVTDLLFGGWQLTGIARVATGAPLTFTDPTGTLNRSSGNRSNRQTPQTSLSKSEIKDLIGIRRTNCGIFFIDPRVIDINLSDCSGTGRAARGFGSAAFPGQVFFNNGPGQTGSLERAFVNGPTLFNLDASLIKNFAITERLRLQVRGEVFNLFNTVNFGVNNILDITSATGQLGMFNVNSPTFGRLQTTVASQGPGADTYRVVQFAARLQF